MRSIELLVRTYPEKTCAEIMKIVEQEKQAHEAKIAKSNKDKLDLIKDINENGGYYKGTFGLDQYFAYNFKNLEFKWDTIICDVENIVVFTGNENERRTVNVKIEFETMKQFENYGVEIYEKITKEEYEKIKSYYVDATPKFWTIIDPKS